MGLNRSILAIAMLAGALGVAGGAGCRRHSQPDDADPQPGSNDTAPATADVPADPPPAAAPTAVATANGGVTDTAVPPPPAERVEVQGTAPSPKHHWVNGYWYWGGHEYTWYPGYWAAPEVVATTAPPALRTEAVGIAPGAGYFYAPGYWRWSGAEYLWAPGHWSVRREG